MQPQMIGQIGPKPKLVNKGIHLWHERADGTFKCVYCGGVTRVPTVNDLCERYESLTPADHALAQQPT